MRTRIVVVTSRIPTAARGVDRPAATRILSRRSARLPLVELALVALVRLVGRLVLSRRVGRILRRVIDVLPKQLLTRRRVIRRIQDVLMPEVVHVDAPRHHHLTRVRGQEPEELAVLGVRRRDPRVLPTLAALELRVDLAEVQRTDVRLRNPRPLRARHRLRLRNHHRAVVHHDPHDHRNHHRHQNHNHHKTHLSLLCSIFAALLLLLFSMNHLTAPSIK